MFPIITPFSYIPSIGIKYILEKTLKIIPIIEAKTGILFIPKACNMAFTVCVNIEKIIPNDDIFKRIEPELAFGNNIFKIW